MAKKAKQQARHLLVVRLSAMGDVAMTVPVVKTLLEQWPQVRVTILTKPFFAPIYADLPVTVVTADTKGAHKGVFGLYKLFKELKPLQIDAVADLHNVLRSTILKTFFVLSGIPVVQLHKGRAEKKALTRAQNKVFAPLPSMHLRYAKVFEELGFPINLNATTPLPKKKLGAKVDQFLANLPISKKVVGIAPFAAFKGKTYPPQLMKMVLDQLNHTDRYAVLLFGGPKDSNTFLDWEAQLANIYSLAGKFSFTEELGLISRLNGMLSMDSGNAHLAALYGVPTITLWGVTHPYAGFYPFGQKEELALLADRQQFPLIPTSVYGKDFPEGYEKAMETISPEMVLRKIETFF